LQSGARGSATFRFEPPTSRKEKIFFKYTPSSGAKTAANDEGSRKDVLISDMLPGFLASHWDELMKGAAPRFRFVVLQRAETIGFKLVKEAETTWHGKPVIIIKMEPASAIIAQFVEPVRFTVEASGQRRILQYVGRTTPLIKRGNKWADLDAVTVFDWEGVK